MDALVSVSVAPAGHRVHLVDPAAAYSPLEHCLQIVIPWLSANFPGAQLVHVVFAPTTGCALPGSHAMQGVDELASWSGEPAGQTAHSAARVPEYVPLGQEAQLSAPAAEILPATHA